MTPLDRYVDDLQETAPSEGDLLSREEETRLARRAQAGDDAARRRLVASNLRFVISYVKRYRGCGLDFEDLVACGNLGMMKAADRYDPDRGVKFISYAVWWIRQTVLEALSDASLVSLPGGEAAAHRRIRDARRDLRRRLGREPTPEEVAEEADASAESVRREAQLGRETRLDAPAGESRGNGSADGESWGDILPLGGRSADSSEDPHGLSEEALDALTERERRILALYYGLGGREEPTLAEIGRRFELSRERIRQLRNRALRKLREAEAP